MGVTHCVVGDDEDKITMGAVASPLLAKVALWAR
jgi:hypothetical protein